jgi:hypothetical protein
MHTTSIHIVFSLLHFFRHRFVGAHTGKLQKPNETSATSRMSHFGLSNEETRYPDVDVGFAFNSLLNDSGEENDLFLGMDIVGMPTMEEIFPGEELQVKMDSFGRKGPTRSPVCVSSHFDDVLGNSSTRSFDTDVVVNNNIVVGRDLDEDDESIEFVEPDKLEKAISELCDPILKQGRKAGMFQMNFGSLGLRYWLVVITPHTDLVPSQISPRS